MLTYYPRLCWEVGVSETWLTWYSWLLVCMPEQIWFTLANQSVRCLISCSWPCNSSQPARFLVPAHFHEEAHAMLNPLGKPTPWTWGRSLSKVWRSITCLWLPSATPVLHEKDMALSPPPSPYSSGSFKVGVAFMEGIYSEPIPTSTWKLAVFWSHCCSGLHLRPLDTRAYGFPSPSMVGAGKWYSVHTKCVNLY